MASAQNSYNNDVEIADLVHEITGDWPHVIEVWEEFRQRHGYYLRADLEADRDEFLKQALWATLGRQHLRALLKRLDERGLIQPGIAGKAETLLVNGFALQSFVNGRWQSQDALTGGRRLLEACDHVCRIAIEGKHAGTGFLLRPTIVATAAHVVAPLLGADNRPQPGALRRLSLTFLDSDSLLKQGDTPPGQLIDAQIHEEWLGYLSPPADGEGKAHYDIGSIEGINHDVGPWDLALIRLAQPPRPGLKGYRRRDEQPAEPCFGMHLLHHPADALGAPMGLLWSIGEMKKRLGHPRALRWLHDANSDRGSSGAPCFDNDWRLVGLHQAGSTSISSAGQNNRAVPIYPWADRVDQIAANIDVTPYVNKVVGADGQEQLVFGRRDFQMRAWRAMLAPLPEAQRVFLVLGDSGTGKTFTISILTELARQAGCRILALDARNAQGETPPVFARRIIGSLGGEFPDISEWSGLTTQLRDIRNEVLPLLAQQLEAIAGDRPLWLVLDGLELCDTAANDMGYLVEGLIEGLRDMPHLNLVLLGWKGSLHTECAEVLPNAILVEDMVTNLLQRLAPPGFAAGAELLVMLRAIVQADLDQNAQASSFAQATATVKSIEKTVKAMIGTLTVAPGAVGVSKI